MMKLFFILMTMLVSSPTYSQKLIAGSFELPAEEKYIAVDWDCSITTFERKYNEQEWGSIVGTKNWENAKVEALGVFLLKMNDEMKKSRLTAINTELGKAAYTIYITPETLDRRGNNRSFYVLKRNADGEELGRVSIKGDGGRWGDLANLLGDGFEEAAEKMGKFLTKHNKMKK